jgi:hypothetical protein
MWVRLCGRKVVATHAVHELGVEKVLEEIPRRGACFWNRALTASVLKGRIPEYHLSVKKLDKGSQYHLHVR